MATIHMGRKYGGLLCPFRGELGSGLIQCGLGRGLLPYHASGVFIHPAGSPSNTKVAWADADLHTKCHLSPSSRLATTDVTLAENWGLYPFRGRGAGSPSNIVAWAEAYLHTEWHRDASSRLVCRHLYTWTHTLNRTGSSASSQ